MQILTVDVGTGTQDILLFDSDREIENCFKLVLPSPTVSTAQRIKAVTRQRRPLVLSGVTMGGGPSHWAAMDHVRAGLPVYATTDAARTFDDDLHAVGEMGIRVVSDDEALALSDRGAPQVFLRDLAIGQILETLVAFGVQLKLSALAVAVFDHGAAPPGYSDRIFRFDYLRGQLEQKLGLSGFAFRRPQIPPAMTRLAAVASTVPSDLPLLMMDTAPAAVLGALDDPRVAAAREPLIVNVGNFHCLAFHLEQRRVVGLFEHHTGEINPARLRTYVEQLAAGTLTNEAIFADKGHGALVVDRWCTTPDLVAVTGPRRALLTDSGIGAHLSVPHGDMMLAGNIGLLRAFADHDAGLRDAIESRLGPASTRPE
ncbi:MAG: DUF1786 domain-containing protein [Chloroflexota bacterium]